jgi:stage V sporulation protein D (sporulation-specific penicillin-binding protein)
MKNKLKIAKKRIILLFPLFAILIIALLSYRLISISLINQDIRASISESSEEQEFRPIFASRGKIFDRNMVTLAESNEAYSLYVNPRLMKDPEVFANIVSPIIGMEEAKVVSIIKQNKNFYFCYIKRKLSKAQKDSIEAVRPSRGDYGFEKGEKREYPKRDTAAPLIGYVGLDNKGLSGLEYTLNDILSGQEGIKIVYHSFVGDNIPGSSLTFKEAKDGNSVLITIDSDLQGIIETILDKHIYNWNADGGVAIVMNPKTGEILAMASKPTYDLNNWEKYANNPKYINRATSMNYEPGSIFKPFVAACALEEGFMTPLTLHECNGSIEVAGKIIKCIIPHGKNQNLSDILRNSCNVSFVKIGLQLKDLLYKYGKRFNFGERLPVEFYGQEKGILLSPKDWSATTPATMSFGQGISVTPLQLISGYAAIANNGVMMTPMIVKEIIDAKGNIIEKREPKVLKKVISEETSKELRIALKNVVEDKNGIAQARIPGLSIAGKTGTANKVEGGFYAPGRYICSFIGFYPAENPEFVILVSIDEPDPSLGEVYGSTVAAPIFTEIVNWLKLHNIK